MRAHLALFVLAILATPCVLATDLRLTPLPERVALAKAIVVGKVTAIEDEPIAVDKAYAPGKVKLTVAKVSVKENLLGAEGLKEIRVAFVPKNDQPNDGRFIQTPVLEKDNEVLLFLRQREGADWYFIPDHFSAVGKEKTFPYQTEDLPSLVGETKKVVKIAADLPAALKSTSADEKMQAAWMLVTRYRHVPLVQPDQKLVETEIDPQESEAIIEGLVKLADSDPMSFQIVAHTLNLEQSGYQGGITVESAQDWLRQHKTDFRIKKRQWVTEK